MVGHVEAMRLWLTGAGASLPGAGAASSSPSSPSAKDAGAAPKADGTPATTGPEPDALPSATARFLDAVAAHVAAGTLDRLVLAKPRGAEPDLQRVTVRPVLLRGVRQWSFTHRHATRDMVKNLDADAALDWLRGRLAAGSFGHAHLFTAGEELQLLLAKKGTTATLRRTARTGGVAAQEASLSPSGSAADGPPRGDAATSARQAGATATAGRRASSPSAASPPRDDDGLPQPDPAEGAAEAPAHDRAKHRFIDIRAPFLAALGITDDGHRLVPAMARKWKQINRFVEVFAHAFEASPLRDATALRVADYGAGKGYLTFALHDWLRRRPGLTALQVTGVEWRADLVDLCNGVVARLGLEGLGFVRGDVRSHALDAVDVMIALHACDTATDHALHRGVRAGAAILLASPCCHKELRPQMKTPPGLQPLLRHGIHLGQQAEMVTDALRALLLEAEGYETSVFEFVSLEHTSKNKMILAVRRDEPASRAEALAARRERVGAQVRALMSCYGVREQALDRLLADDAPAVSPGAPSDAASQEK